MKVIVKDVSIRGHEVKENKNGDPYILINFDDETGEPCKVVDKDMDRAKFYTRGTTGDLKLDIKVGKFTSIRVVDFTITNSGN